MEITFGMELSETELNVNCAASPNFESEKKI